MCAIGGICKKKERANSRKKGKHTLTYIYRIVHIYSLLNMTESDDDEPQLSQSTLAALQEFYAERVAQENQLTAILNKPDEHNLVPDVKFDEDWQLSQFWYDETTVNTIIKGALSVTADNAKIALISCPTLYKALKIDANNRQVKLLEFDTRFAVYGSDFLSYDYKSPLSVPKDMTNDFDLVIADPPFLSEECLTKTAITIKLLAKKKILLCTGAIMADLAERLLGVRKCKFEPHHTNNLANEFWCYSNFDFDSSIE